MTVYEFLTLPTKEKGKYCRKQGIVKHRTFPKTYEELCKVLNLVDDKTVIVDYYNTSDSGLMWFYIWDYFWIVVLKNLLK